MTIEEAIERIEQTIYYYESQDMDDEEEKDCESLYMAVSALEAILALEKQIPKKHRIKKRGEQE